MTYCSPQRFQINRHQALQEKKGKFFRNHPILLVNDLDKFYSKYDEDCDIKEAAFLFDVLDETTYSAEERKEVLNEIEEMYGVIVAGYVDEINDATDSKEKRIENAKKLSNGGKVIRLAEKIFSVWDVPYNNIDRLNVKQIQEHCIWCKKVVDTIRGTNEKLENEFDRILAAQFEYEGEKYDKIPKK